ncbi:MAG: hypothetical protein IIZ92_00075, partial [Aquincola sp.]|nr:hypothetical protein [Aquincola sp.]
MPSSKWRSERGGADWLMDSLGRLIGYRDEQGNEYKIPSSLVPGGIQEDDEPSPSQVEAWNGLPITGNRVAQAQAVIKSTGYDQTAELQQAANDLYASMGGDATQSSRYNTGFAIKLMDGQEYAVSNLVMPPGMTLASVSGALTPFSDKPSDTSGAVPVSTGPVLRHISPNQPMIENDTTRGIIRTTGVRFALNTILGLTMVSDRFASTRRGDAPFVFWRSAFGLDFIGNNLFTSAGFGLKVVTCNALRIRDNYALYAPWF